MWTILSVALAAPPGFTEVRTTDGCVLSQGPTEDDGVAPMLAECHWPGVDPAQLAEALGRFDRYEEHIFGVERSDTVRVDGARTLVHQVGRARGIAPREVLLWMTRETRPDGALRFTWTTATDEPLEVARPHVRAPRNEGWWEVAPHPDGGAKVAHYIAYDPGGSVPSWVVRWAQTGGLAQVMSGVRDHARAATERSESAHLR